MQNQRQPPQNNKNPSKILDFRGTFWRRERDSNPCEIALKRFSRPPRYDRFDIPPDNCKLFYKLLINQCKYHYTIMLLICQYSF